MVISEHALWVSLPFLKLSDFNERIFILYQPFGACLPISLFQIPLTTVALCCLWGGSSSREGTYLSCKGKVINGSCTQCCHNATETDPHISSSFSAIRKILFDFCSSGACVLTASHLSIAILDRVEHQIAAGLACGNKNDAGVPEGGRALL